MRKFLFLLFLLTFWGLRLSAIEPPTLPFAYVTYNEDTLYDFHIMDIETSEEIYSVVTPDYDCPVSISPDAKWLIYTKGYYREEMSYLVDLTTGEEYTFFDGRIHVEWASDSSRMAYTYDDDNTSLYIFDMESRFLQSVGRHYVIVAYQWVANELLFIVDKQNELEIHKWNGTEQFILNVIRRPLGDVSATISPNGRFIQTIVRTTNKAGDRVQIISVASIETGQDVLDRLIIYRFGAWLTDSSGFAYFDNQGSVLLHNLLDNSFRHLGEEYRSSYLDFALLLPSESHLAYRKNNAGGTYNENYSLMTIDLETSEVHLIKSWVSTDAGQMQWVSATQLVYTYANSENSSELNDIWLYDAETQENTQITNTPNLDEQFGYEWCG